MAIVYRCIVLGLLLGIGYDTSANVSPVEGARAHLSFGGLLLCGLGGAVVGGVIVFVRSIQNTTPIE